MQSTENKILSRAVFRDDVFGSDSVKINVEQIFKSLSPVGSNQPN